MNRPSTLCANAALLLGLVAHVACATAASDAPPIGATVCRAPVAAPGAPRLLPGLGDYSLPISGATPLVQRWFNQGLVLGWAFNFAAAQSAMLEATRLAPGCAMCWWGLAYVPGPSVNHDLTASERRNAHHAVERAAALAGADTRLTPRERGLIAALRLRHAAPESADRHAHEAAWALALDQLRLRFPADADLLALSAEARMAPSGRNYWSRDGRALPGTAAILGLLEQALLIAPDHPAANHWYVHALEEAPRAQLERARDAATRLARIAPGAGHLRHMPAHVDLRLGRYAEAVAANQQALAADREMAGASGEDRVYATGYVDHHHHYLWAAALMAGQGGVAREQAQALARSAAERPAGTAAHWRALPLYTAIRLGDWPAIAATPRPAPHRAYTDGVWHVARGLARLRAGDAAQAQTELAAARIDHQTVARKQVMFKASHPLESLLGIALDLLAAEIAAAGGDHAQALRLARGAVAAEDALDVDEPPAWHMPARHTLGALLLLAGRAPDAVRVYQDDLAQHPDNGWALIGLARAHQAAGQPADAARARAAFDHAWRSADRGITTSRL